MSFLAALALACAARPADAAGWRVDHEASHLDFVAFQSGQPVEGVFRRWSAEIEFDPADPAAATVSVEVETASLDSGSGERDGVIRSPDLLAVETFPVARFQAQGFKDLGDGRYEAPGSLTLRDKTLELSLPFTLTLEGDDALAVGEATIDRLEYGVGQGQWRDTSLVPAEVRIAFTVKAKRSE
jgi:polyisoprenoid-binding protein YceI